MRSMRQIRRWITADTELYVRAKRWWSWARLTHSPRTVHSFLKSKLSGVPLRGFLLRVSIIRVIPNCAIPELPAQGSRTLNSARGKRRACLACNAHSAPSPHRERTDGRTDKRIIISRPISRVRYRRRRPTLTASEIRQGDLDERLWSRTRGQRETALSARSVARMAENKRNGTRRRDEETRATRAEDER